MRLDFLPQRFGRQDRQATKQRPGRTEPANADAQLMNVLRSTRPANTQGIDFRQDRSIADNLIETFRGDGVQCLANGEIASQV